MIEKVNVELLHDVFGWDIAPVTARHEKPLDEWKMEDDDSPIFRYIYKNFRPKRHLEFGTWQGEGVMYCLEECQATIWTINLPDGEAGADGSWVYSGVAKSDDPVWSDRMETTDAVWIRSDAKGCIGRKYREAGMGRRVCQIYCDSREWEIDNYPEGFFDTVLVDGGHSPAVVVSDTRKGLRLLRSGGLIMWHDFCPPVESQFESTRGVGIAIRESLEYLNSELSSLYWINPSWILIGVKK